MDKFRIKIRIVFWFILGLVVTLLLYLAIVPFGKITYLNKFEQEGEFIGKLAPKVRLEESAFPHVIIGDPVYFTLRTSRRFDQANLHLKYRNKNADNLSNPIIEAGALVDKTVWRYDMRPVENKIIDSIGLVWDKMTDGDLVLLQKEKKFSSILDFQNALKEAGKIDLDKVAVYNYDLKTEYLLNDYKSSTKDLIVDKAMRGAYQFYTYVDKEDLRLAFEFTDLNMNRDADSIDVRLYHDKDLIEKKHLDDDGVMNDNGQESTVRKLDFEVANLATGVYKIEVKVNDDIVTQKITTKQNKLAFINGIRLHDTGAKNLAIYTDSKRIQAKTIYPGLLQIIKAGENDLILTETYKQFEADVKKSSSSDKMVKIMLEKDGVFLNGNGVFSFTPSALIDPNVKKIDVNADIKGDGIEYVLAEYKSPVGEGEWKETTVPINLRGAYREGGKYSFLISIPGLKMDDGVDDGIILNEIRVDLTGQSVFGRIKKLFLKMK